ncbi:serine hydrolase domain-containing protein [Phenylobacterium sp.]|uniref:serine hydrolase domain-containing protein n=1 Tax=Phenylobacterium sp. TaxID=1871053 RepID=UPI00286B9718|nr:serine hydrolase domain-containing protein [Phenylobacterium sp.]
MTRPLDGDVGRRLDEVFDRALAEQRIVGGVVLVAEEGRRAYARAGGMADRAAGRPVTFDTIFRLASLTKPMVTAAALSLIEDGALGFEDPVTRWLPDFKPALGNQTPTLTIRQLLTHTAGLSYGFMQPDDGPYLRLGVSDGMDQPGLGFATQLGRIVAAGLTYPPGAAWLYSVSLDVLGAVLEQAARKPLARVMAERVATPLGLKDTGFSVTDPARLAVAYADATPPVEMGETCTVPFAELSGIRFAPGRAFDADSFPSGGAGMVGTAGEFLAFLEAIRTGGGGVVGAGMAAEMMRNQTGDLSIVTNGPGFGFGFGGAVLLDPAAAGSGHSPGVWLWGGVYGHSWFVDPARRLSVLVMTNTAIEGMTGAFATEVAGAVQAG